MVGLSYATRQSLFMLLLIEIKMRILCYWEIAFKALENSIFGTYSCRQKVTKFIDDTFLIPFYIPKVYIKSDPICEMQSMYH